MRELASIEMHILAGEFGGIVGAYLKKFYDLGNDSFKISFSQKGAASLLYCKLVRTVNITSFTEAAGEATNFAMAMRKRVEGAKVVGIEQVGSDRIMAIGLESAHGIFRLVVEMYGKGNMLLLDKESTIVLAYKTMEQKSRTIRPKVKYDFPKTLPFDFSEDSLNTIVSSTDRIEGRLITTLSRSLNLGPLYVEDIINSCGLSPNLKSLGGDQKKRLKDGIKNFHSKLEGEKPRIYVDPNGKYIDYAIVSIEKYKDYQSVEFDSLSALLDRFYLGDRSQSREVDRKLEELRISLAQQMEMVGRVEAEGKEYFDGANSILNNMGEINKVIEYLKQNRRASIDELRAHFPKLKLENLNLKEKTVIIEME